jgi:hypothetical protein
MVVSITTAGFDRESICYQLYKRGKRLRGRGRPQGDAREGFLMRWYEAPRRRLARRPRPGSQANPSGWIRRKDLEREAKRLPESVFRRLHLNQWTETEDAWIKPYEWDACRGRPSSTSTAADRHGGRRGHQARLGRHHLGPVARRGPARGQEIMLPEVEGTELRRGRHPRPAGRSRPDTGVQARSASTRGRSASRPRCSWRWACRWSSSPRTQPHGAGLRDALRADRQPPAGPRRRPELREQVLNAVIAPTERGGWRSPSAAASSASTPRLTWP